MYIQIKIKKGKTLSLYTQMRPHSIDIAVLDFLNLKSMYSICPYFSRDSDGWVDLFIFIKAII